MKRFEECKLGLHPVKTRIVYYKDKDRTKGEELTEFDFLGYTFKAVYMKCRDGVMRHNFIALVSKTSAKKTLEIHKKTGCKIEIIAEMLNPLIRGWMNYFGKFNPSAMKYTLQCIERRIVKWAMCKYKNFRGHRKRAEKWLWTVRKREPELAEEISFPYIFEFNTLGTLSVLGDSMWADGYRGNGPYHPGGECEGVLFFFGKRGADGSGDFL